MDAWLDEASHPDHKLTVLPQQAQVRRARTTENRVARVPASIQDWFDAAGDDPGMDERLRRWLDRLVPDIAPATPADDPPMARQRASEERLAEQPLLVQEWFDAVAESPRQDAALRGFVDGLAPSQSRPPQALSHPASTTQAARRWQTWAWVAGTALAAGGLLALTLHGFMPRGTADSQAPSETTQLARAQSQRSPALSTYKPAAMGAHPDQKDADRPGTGRPDKATGRLDTEPASDPATLAQGAESGADIGSFAPQQPAHSAPAALTVLAKASPGTADQTAAKQAPADETLDLETQPSPPPVVVALRSSGELDATHSPWQGAVVSGLDLRLDAGFGELSGTHSSPLLTLSNDAELSVDLDRVHTDGDFANFTIQTVSATIRVVGTQYTVSTQGGRTRIRTTKGVVQVECTDGHRKLVSAGQQATCSPTPDPRLLLHMQALDRPPVPGQPGLTPIEQYAHLQRLRNTTSPQAFIATADIILARALADEGLRSVVSSVRLDAMCALGWDGPARQSAQAWLDAGGQIDQTHVEAIAAGGCIDR
ncbi:MAG: hypothetical protein GXP62_13510 [Oligoflexia bacterium]|nr:hypothetical protein [Oligoflexia bacterium]